MQQTVYADLLFLINFSMDYLCLYICAKVLRHPMRFWRLLLASAVGGIYSIVALFISAHPAAELAVDALVCLGISAIAFSGRGRKFGSLLLTAFLFVGISMMTGGAMTAIFNLLNRLELPLEGIDGDGISTYLFAIIAAVAGAISLRSGMIISRRSNIRECRLTLTICGKSRSMSAMVDTGNLVKDPLSGKCVILIDRNELSHIVDVSEFDDFAAGSSRDSPYLRGLRLIPIKTASGRSLLCSAMPDKLEAEFTTKKGRTSMLELDALIAPSDIRSSAEGALAIIPAEILKV